MNFQTGKQNSQCDRFIPFRDNAIALDSRRLFRANGGADENCRVSQTAVLSFKPNNAKPVNAFDENYLPREAVAFKKSRDNSIALHNSEAQILRATGFRNDYYTNSLDCRDEDTFVCVLDNAPYLFRRRAKAVEPLIGLQSEELITSVKFQPEAPNRIAFGGEFGALRLYDGEKSAAETFDLHVARIGCLDWNPKAPFLLAAGSKDKLVRFKDFRAPDQSVVKLGGHAGEICGLSWSRNGLNIASGGNDNLVNVWDLRAVKSAKASFASHKAAVRALCWAPFKDGLLASGGGSGDMRVLVHNVDSGKLVKEITTDSQVCAIAWDEPSKALITGHGFSRYQVCLWDYERQRFVYEFLGHGNRVLSLFQTRPGGMVVSASPDETIRVWDVRKVLRSWEKDSTVLAPVQMR